MRVPEPYPTDAPLSTANTHADAPDHARRTGTDGASARGSPPLDQVPCLAWRGLEQQLHEPVDDALLPLGAEVGR